MDQGRMGPPALHPTTGQVKGPGDGCAASKPHQSLAKPPSHFCFPPPANPTSPYLPKLGSSDVLGVAVGTPGKFKHNHKQP